MYYLHTILPKGLENEGITDKLHTAMIVYLISHDHSPHSLLNPVLHDVSQEFEQNFAGMTEGNIELETLHATRERLIRDVVANMPQNHKAFTLFVLWTAARLGITRFRKCAIFACGKVA